MPEAAPTSVRQAFTIIELVVVMAIIAILASLAVYSLGGTTDRYQLNRAVETMELFDARARRDARTHHRALQASIHRDRGLLTIAANERRDDVSFRLPSRVKIKEIRMRRQVVAGGNFEMDINSGGQSPSYAVHLQRGQTSRWIVVLGLSGQVIKLDTRGEVDAILSL